MKENEKVHCYIINCLRYDSGSGFFQFCVFRTPTQQANTTPINGRLYSTKPTSYGRVILDFFTLLPKNESDPKMDFGMSAQEGYFYLLSSDETAPPHSRVDNGSAILILPLPDPSWPVMIDHWLYAQTPTNLTEFTMPQFATPNPLWTETANEPIPTGAQILG